MEEEECKCEPGIPAWMATFADLMSLLMCFFVLLLAFSEMDVLKFKQIAGSMKYAFGVQNQIEVKDIPKGTSVIAQEFRPGRPDPTPIEEITQQTMDMTQQTLEFQAGKDDSSGGQSQNEAQSKSNPSFEQTESESDSSAVSEAAAETAETAKQIAQQLEEQIVDGAIEIEALGQQIIIRIREQGAFPSGSAFLQPKFKPIVREVASLLKDVPGEVTISGHTDDNTISSELYRSNWDLSSQRAVAVAHEMMNAEGFEDSRMMVVGRADSMPLVPNSSDANRRKNRRVEISIMQGKAKESREIQVTQ
ncbi:flagellar motor protein MotB [Echinimonas agarilytica]|uniref:Flagellar motor protein MotB n=1 Tax=Echinimonas agarilytica TaxID=1215918 RepID=A0AA41W7C9_9GAMM|nr:flagellar motor protein MotB [Echinimonas agarilytica]MCM2680547.1 flagellar motor protein MotB [Echinimonas agarilytica]